MTRRRLVLLGCLLVATLAVLKAEGYVFETEAFKEWQDIEITRPPCVLAGPAGLTIYEEHTYILFTCLDGHVWMRRFFNQGEGTLLAIPSGPASKCPGVSPGPGFTCGTDGGWKPPGWVGR